MNTIRVHRADPIGDKPATPVTIVVDLEQPPYAYDDPNWQTEATRRFRDDAVAVADALWATLPGGTLDQLVVEMLSRRVTLLRVPMLEPRP